MIIESLLDTDLYKFTMQQCVLHQFPAAEVSYRFKCRTPNIDLSPFIDEINAEIDHLYSPVSYTHLTLPTTPYV